MFKKNSITQGDSLELLKKIPDKSIDLIFADPPYNLQLRDTLYRPDQTTVEAVTNDWDKFDTYQAYDEFSLTWLQECKRVLKDGGALWVIGSYHNILRLGTSIQNLGFWILNDIIWHKTNPMPNFRGTRFTNAHETLLWCTTSRKAKYTFNYQNLKELNEGKQMRSDWHIPICSGKERLREDNNQRSHPTNWPCHGLLPPDSRNSGRLQRPKWAPAFPLLRLLGQPLCLSNPHGKNKEIKFPSLTTLFAHTSARGGAVCVANALDQTHTI